MAATAAILAPITLPAGEAGAQVDEIAQIECDPVAASQGEPEVRFESYVPQLAERIVDTRNSIGGLDEPLDRGCTLRVSMLNAVPEGVQGVALSVTVVAQEEGFFTAFPCAQGLPGTSSVNARPGLATANLVTVAPDSAGDVCIYSDAGGHVIVDVSGWWLPGTDVFTAIEPTRAYDTRQLDVAVKLPAGDVRDVDVAGEIAPEPEDPDAVDPEDPDNAGLPESEPVALPAPADATAVAITLTAVNPDDTGFLVVYPCGELPPLASNLNFDAGETRAVSALVEVGVFGKICVTGSATAHFLIDVTGFVAPSSGFVPAVELAQRDGLRVVDTRRPEFAGERFDGDDQQRFVLSDFLEFPSDTTAVVLNMVATQADASGFVTVHPCVEPRPVVSVLNYSAGQTANLVVTSIGEAADVCVYASTGTHVVIDLVGAFVGAEESVFNQVSMVIDDQDAQIDQEFVPGGADYTMRCGDVTAADDEAVEVRLRIEVEPGATGEINGDEMLGLDWTGMLGVDGSVSVSAARDGLVETHHFRCVPDDFPFLSVTESGEREPGWYLTELGWTNPNHGTFLAILDQRGVPVWFKRTERKLIDVKVLSNGMLVASQLGGRGFGLDPASGHRVFELDGSFVDLHLPENPTLYPSDHHDYIELPAAVAGDPSGRAIVSYPIIPAQDLTAMPIIDPATGQLAALNCGLDVNAFDRNVAAGIIQEIPADANEPVWTWNMLDHFSYAEVTYAQCFNNLPDADGGEVDVFHINSLDRVEEAGCEPLCDYVVSARHIDAVFRVDRVTGAVEWILSSEPSDPLAPGYVAPASGAPRMQIIDDPYGGPRRMHDARLMGNVLTMHDNRTGTSEPSRFVAYRLDVSDPLAPTATLIRQIDHPEGLTSNQLGSARLAEDGSVLVSWGATQPIFVEYDVDDAEVLRITMPASDSAYRIVKYPLEQFDADVLRDLAGGSLDPVP